LLGITLTGAHGLGDKLQFSSFPENYWRSTGNKVVDLDCHWFFDSNPYVLRDLSPDKVVNLWHARWESRLQRMLSLTRRFSTLAERTSGIFGAPTSLIHPRLYRYEDAVIDPNLVVIHTTGSHKFQKARGEDCRRVMPQHIIDHVKTSYRDRRLVQVGGADDLDAGVEDMRGRPYWVDAELISRAAIFIGVDSGLFWIASCFPRVIKKKVLVQYPASYLRNKFFPMNPRDSHTHWHEPNTLYFNRTDLDAGITYSYTKI
jgi:hypothetical protein